MRDESKSEAPISGELAGAAAAVVNSRAADKLANAVAGLVQVPQNILDYIAGPKRIAAVEAARAEGALAHARAQAEATLESARAQAELEKLRAETAEYLLDHEMRRTLNRRAIIAEAAKALPPPSTPVADEKVSPDFVHTFFDEFDGISDPVVQRIVGRLFAGEVVKPGSYPRRTLRVLRDLESSDFRMFTELCRFSWNLGGALAPLVFNLADEIYRKHDVTFANLTHLDSLGLLTFDPLAGYALPELPAKVVVTYATSVVLIEPPKTSSNLSTGKVLLSDAGKRLAPLTNAEAIPECLDYTVAKWTADGHKVTIVTPLQKPPSQPQG
ncbi:MAG: DUF2806 domain-containing protein [Hyphomicrobiaceae bacterium]|nr:DUF2806 domain-containing protein [Hyphomicrobiaceae bacterium]